MTRTPLSPHFLPDLIEARLAAHKAANPAPRERGDYLEWSARRRAFAEELLAELLVDYGCRYRISYSEASRMRLAGISISCTSGPYQMLRNWCRKARAAAIASAEAAGKRRS